MIETRQPTAGVDGDEQEVEEEIPRKMKNINTIETLFFVSEIPMK